MNRPSLTSLMLLIVASCGSSSSDTNPAVLFLAPANGEASVTLIDHAPPVF